MRALYAGGAVAGPIFVGSFLLQGAVKPDYDPARHPVSSLALGPYGWVQAVTFVGCGALTVAFAVALARLPGVRRKLGAVLVGVWGLGLVGAGVFVTDPVSGYPPGTPPTPIEPTAAGTLHDLFSVPAFFALAAACFVLAAGAGWRWAGYSVLSGLAFLATFFVFGAGFSQTEPFVDVAGAWQRVCIVIGWAWVTALAVRTRGQVDWAVR